MTFHHRAITEILQYTVDGKASRLEEAKALIDAEIERPSIMQLRLQIKHTTADLDKQISETNSLTLAGDTYHTQHFGDATHGVYEGGIVRVITSDQEEDSCFLFHVTRKIGDELILSPVLN